MTSRTKQDEIPRPMIFAIMRNGHEVIRAAMKEVEEALNQDDLKKARTLWKDLKKWGDIHMRMEEGPEDSDGTTSPIGMFRLLDMQCENVTEDNELRNHHSHLYEFEEDIDDAFKNATNVSDSVKASFASFMKENLSHLAIEEKIMMPNVMKLSQSGKPLKKYMIEEVFPLCKPKEREFFIKFANKILQDHEDGMPRVRVFDHALWAIATPDEWKQYDGWIKETLRENKYEELHQAINLWKEFQNEQKSQMALQTEPEKKTEEQAAAPVVAARQEAAAAGGCCTIL